TFNGSLNGSHNGSVNGLLNGTLINDPAYNGTINGSYSGTYNGSFNGTVNGSYNSAFDSLWTGAAGGTLVIEAQNQLIPSTSITDFSQYTLDQMDVLCPATRIRDTLAGGVDVDLVLPKLITMNGVHERLYRSCGNTEPTTCPVATVSLAEDFDGNGSSETN